MQSTIDFTRECRELQNVLSSGIFERSPALAHLLSYVCTKYFDGSADEIKEYTVAVDALGRAPEFDPKQDSIIRVQFHRMRERLAYYYAHDGANNAVQIMVPPGQYAPRFIFKNDASVAVETEHAPETPLIAEEPRLKPPLTLEEVSLPAPSRSRAHSSALILALCLVGFSVLGGVFILLKGHGEAPKPVKVETAVPMPVGDSVRIVAGLAEGSFTDGYGRTWLSDRYFSGGTVINLVNHPIWGTRDAKLYQNRRQGDFHYDIPLRAGVYELRLYFAETHFGEENAAGYGGENTRSFGILLNGETVKRRLSVAGEAGINVASVKVFRDVRPAADGYLHLSFTKYESEPFVNAIEITPGFSQKLSPILLVAQPRGYTDREGRVWEPDRLAVGGQLAVRKPDLALAADQQLYNGERFGNFSYTIPVTPGRYTVILHMSERWLGPGQAGGGPGIGSRVFEILCNGVALERDMDVYARAGGPDRAVAVTYHSIEANHQGNIVLSFVPAKNYAIINAVEVLDEAKPD